MEVSRVDMVSQRVVIIVSERRGLLPFLVEYPPIHRHTHTQCSLPISRDYDSETHDSLQSSDPLLLSSQQFAIIANYTQVCILALIVTDFISFL